MRNDQEARERIEAARSFGLVSFGRAGVVVNFPAMAYLRTVSPDPLTVEVVYPGGAAVRLEGKDAQNALLVCAKVFGVEEAAPLARVVRESTQEKRAVDVVPFPGFGRGRAGGQDRGEPER